MFAVAGVAVDLAAALAAGLVQARRMSRLRRRALSPVLLALGAWIAA
jgi:hypothetical protein